MYIVGEESEQIGINVANIKHNYPQAIISGYHHGYFSNEETQAVIEQIKKIKPQFIFVGLGFPKQEYFTQKLEEAGIHAITIGIGGAIDVVSGQKYPAPRWVMAIKCEWLFRATQEPRRVLRWKHLIKFIQLVLVKRLMLQGSVMRVAIK